MESIKFTRNPKTDNLDFSHKGEDWILAITESFLGIQAYGICKKGDFGFELKNQKRRKYKKKFNIAVAALNEIKYSEIPNHK